MFLVDSVTNQLGDTGELYVWLKKAPTDDVVYGVTANDAALAYVMYPSVLTFRIDNWDIPQPIMVQGREYVTSIGDVDYNIVLSLLATTDPYYSEFSQLTVATFVNEEAEWLTVTTPDCTSGREVDEEGTVCDIHVSLKFQPSSSVDVTVTISDTGKAIFRDYSGSTHEMSFTSTNFNTSQIVTVKGEDNSEYTVSVPGWLCCYEVKMLMLVLVCMCVFVCL